MKYIYNIHENLKAIRIIAAIFIPIIVLGGLIFLFSVNPEKTTIFPCFFRFTTHLDCPGCGMTRALYNLLHLNLWQAFRYNLILYLLIPISTYFGIIGYIYLLTGKWFKLKLTVPKPVILCLIVVIVAFVILRNIPIEPFSYFKV
jgi:hypothetical protein